MKKWVHKIELFVDKIIPYLLIILLFIIAGELFFYETLKHYHFWVEAADWFIIFMFIVDLGFKYNRVRNVPSFLRRYWLDVIAVFPFFLLFRLVDEAMLAIGRIFGLSGETWQRFLHIGVETGKLTEEARLLSDIEREEKLVAEIGKGASRGERFARILRPVARMPRFLRAFDFFEHPEKEVYLSERRK